MKRKILALLTGTVMAVGLMAGCGSSGSSASQEDAGTQESSSVAVSEAADESGEETASSEDDGTVYTMRIGTLTVETEINTYCALQFAELIEEATDGRVVAEVYPSAQLGTAAQMVEGMQNGTIEAGLFPTDWAISADPNVAFVTIPNVAGASADEICGVMNDLGGIDIANETLESVGLHLAGVLMTDTYSYLLSDDEVQDVSDISGMSIWSPPSDYTSALISSMGATATFFDTSDLAVSVQQGTIDGALAAPVLFVAQKLYENFKYCTGFVGRAGVPSFIMSESFLESLPDDLRATVEETAMTAIKDYEYAYAEEICAANLTTLEENGVTVLMSDEIDTFQAELEELYQENLDLYLTNAENGQEIYDRVHALLEQYRGE